jgi:hypothetical protein
MIEYSLLDIDDNEMVLNDATIVQPVRGSLTFKVDEFIFDSEIVESSALDGARKLGETRIQSRNITIEFSRAQKEDFQVDENTLIEFLIRSVLLVDNTNSLSMPIAVSRYRLGYDPGGHKLSSDNEIELVCLNPFWSAITATHYDKSIAIGTNTLSITNLGFRKVPPLITLTASAALTSLQIYVDETKEGIQIDDSIFGTPGYETMIIDCINGTIMIGSLNRSESILPGTGYFTIPVGVSALKIISTAVAADMDVDFNIRKHI